MTALVRIVAGKRRRAALGVVALVLAGAVVYVQIAAASVTVTSGNASETADQANAGTWVTLSPNIAVAEGARGDFGGNTASAWSATNLVLTPPSGWQFNAAQTITPTFSGPDITGATATVAAGGTSITVTLTGSGKTNGTNDTFALPSVQVRPTATTPLSSGSIGCSSVNNINGITCGTTTFGTLTETVGALSKLTITSAPASATAGSNFSVTVKSTDAYGNPVNVGSNTAIQLNPSGTGTISNNSGTITVGTNTLTLSTVQYTKAESLTLVAHRNSGAVLADSAASSAITVNPGAFTKVQLLVPGETADPGSATGKTGTPSTQTAGSSFNVTANAVDANWNVVTSVTDTVGISSSDANAGLPANAALVAGTKTFSATLKTAGSKTVTATDITDGSKTANTSPSITVNAGAFSKLQLLVPGETASPGSASGKTGTPSAQTAGTSFNVTVNAVDANWNPVSSTDTVGITSSDANAALPANAALVAGTKTFSVTLKTAGSRTVTATDITDGSKTANTSPSITVNAGAFTKLQLLVPGETADPGSATGKTGAPSTQTAGSSFNVTVNAVDANWNVVSSTDTAGITSSDSNAGLPANAALVAGTKTFSVTLKTAGSRTFTATDITDGSKTASTSPSITVNAGAFMKLQLLVPGETASPGSATGNTGAPSALTAGASFSVTVNAVDSNWNLVSSTDTVGITSSDANAGLPANAALVAGTKTFSITLKTAGSRTVTATDITDGSKTANTSPAITVNAGAFTKLQLLVPGETADPGTATGKMGTPSAQTAGTSFNVTVNAVDANWNSISSTDTVGISSSDSNAGLPANAALVAGTKTFNLTLKTAGSRTITATDISDGTKTANTSPSITVNAGAFSKLQLLVPGETAAPGSATGKTGTPSAQTAGSSFSVTANAVDANWNLVSSTDTVAISSSDANFAPPANAALVAGTKAFSVSLPTAGSSTLSASDATDGSKTASTSPSIAVNAGAFAKLQLLVPGETAAPGSGTGKTGTPSAQTAGSSFTVTVNAVDANWNVISSTDTVGITSSDANAALPANAALVAGIKTFSVTLKTTGSRTVTATDITDSTKTANTSPTITVNAGAFAKLQLLVPGETASPGSATGKTGSPSAHDEGAAFTVTVNAVDASWNLVSSTDTVGVTSSDSAATLPSNAALLGGTKTFSVTLNTPGSRTVSATDVTDGSKTADTSPGITVNDVTPPTFSSAAANGTSLTATFSETLDAGSVPAASAWTVVRNGTATADPTNVSISGADVTLTLAAPVRNGDTITLAYTQPGSNELRDPSANAAASFGAQAVTNNTASIAPDVPPLVSPAAGVEVNATPTLTATFSDTDTNNTGQLTFQICSDSSCASVVTTLTSPSGLANGANGSATVPGGTFTSGGTFYWRAKATDNTSAASTYGATRSFVVDSTPPALQTVTVNGTTLTLTYDEALDPGSVPVTVDYGLHLNGGSAVAPANVSLSGSTVTLTFAAGTVHNGDAAQLDYTAGASPVRDSLHNDSANLTNAVVTNNTVSLDPDVPALATPAAGVQVNSATPSLSATFTDPDSQNTGQLTFQVCADAACSSVLATFSSAAGVANGANASASVPGGTITADGTYHWRAKATDDTSAASAYGATRSLLVDTVAPAFTSAAVNGTALVVTMSEALDSGSTPAPSAWTVVRNGSTLPDPTNVSVSGSTATLTLASTVHYGDTVTVAYAQLGSNRLRDLAANDAAGFAAQPVTNDTPSAAPNDPSLVSPANGASLTTFTPALTAGFSDPDTANTGQLTFQLCSDAGCASPIGGDFTSASGVANGANGSASVPAGRITADGTYYWRAKATDDAAASSSFSGTRSFTVDTTSPPVPSIDAGPAGGSTSSKDVSFSFSDAEGGVTFEVQLDGGGWNVATSPQSFTNLSDGSHTFDVRAKDALDNASAPRTRTWTVDATPPPTPTIDSGPATGGYSTADPSFGFSDTEGGVNFEVRLDGGGWGSATSPKSYSGLSEASHTFAVRATDPYGNVSGATSRTWNVDATAPTVSITAPANGANLGATVSITSSENDTGGSGLDTVVYQYSQAGQNNWNATTAAWNTALLSDGDYDVRAIATDVAGNTTTSALVTNLHVDNHAPTVTLSAPQYVNALDPGSLTLTASSPDTDLQDVKFYECSNASAGCSSGSWNLVATDATAPYSASWTVPLSDGNKAVRALATDSAANTGSDVQNVWVDRTLPAGGSVDYADGYASGSVTITTTNGNDGSGSGLNLASAALERDETGLAADACSFGAGSWSAATSPDSTIQTANCYRYRYRISDNAGNERVYTSANVVKVDTTAPTAVTLGWSGLSSAYRTGSTVYFKQGGSGGFTITTTSSDPQSGIQQIAYPGLGAGWTHTAGGYAFDATANAPGGSSTITATNNAGLSSTATFDVVADAAPPAGGAVSYADGYHSLTNVDLTLDDGSDGGSGLDSTSEVLERSDGTLSGGSCAGFAGFAPLATDPALSYNDGSVASGSCYRYRYVVSDRVGNSVTYTSANTVKIDAGAPTGSIDDPGPYLRGTVNLTAGAGDTGGSGVDAVTFQRSSGGPWTTIATDSDGAPYTVSFDTTTAATPDGLYDLRVVVTDGADNQTVSAVVSSRRIDNTAPSATLNDPGAYLRGTVNLTSSSGDAGSGVASTTYQYFQQIAGGPWTTTPAAFDTTTGSTPDGLYDVRVVVTDNAGNSATDTISGRPIDNTPPTATLDDPGQFLRGALTFTSSTADPGGSGVASVVYQRSAAGAGSYANVAQPWLTTPADDGIYDLRVRATDNAGNVTSSLPVTNVVVDNTAPAVSVTSPVAGAPVTGTVNITTSTTDGGSGVQSSSIEFAHHGVGDWTATPAAWDTTLVADGLYDLRAKATDRAGNNATSVTVANVLVDNQAPTVSFSSPTAGQYVNAASPDPRTLTAAAGDSGSGVADVEFFGCSDTSTGCGTGTWVSLGAPDTTGPYDGTLPVPADGNRALKAVVTDNVGRTASAVIDVTVDRTLPDTTILTKPGDPSNVASPSFTFDSSETGSSFECRVDAGAWSACTSPATIGPLTDGSHTFDVRATDAAGNTDATEATWTWLVDLTPPTATLDDPGRNVRGTIALTSTQADPGANASGIATVTYEYSADGSTWAGTPAAWDTTLVSDGVYALHVVVTDNAGNTATSAAVANVLVDNTPPTTSVDDPGANLRQTVNVTGSANDAGSGVTQVDFQISPAGANAWTTFGSAAAAPYSVPLDTTGYTDGLYDLRTVATDAAGNVTQGAPVVNRRIDNTPPAASLSSPGSPLRGNVPLSSTSGDGAGSGVATLVYEASRNGGAYMPIAQNWNTITSGDGTYDLHVVVTDVAGNVTTSAAVSGIVVDNTASTTTDNAPAGWQSSPVTVTLSANDAGSGVATTKYSVDGGGWQTGNSVGVPTTDGAHTISYYSVDVAGNVESSKSATVLMQTTPPSCPSCTAADYLRGTVTLTASPTTTSGGAPITDVVFMYQNSSGGPVATIGSDPTAPYSVDWDTTGVPDAGYDLIYEVHDAANNVAQTTIGSRVVDNTAPTTAVGSPAPGTVVSGTVSFGASVTDANLASVDYYVNGSQVGSTAGAAINWNTSSVADGNASLSVVATDRAGNSTASAAIAVVVDNDPPTISVSAPPVASGTVTITASASADTSSVEFQRRALPGGAWTPFATDASAPYSADLVTTALPDGDYELRGVAMDNAGHATASGAQPMKIDNTAPTGSIATPAGGATVGGNVTLTANANDPTSGVASVAYELRPTGGASFSGIGSASSSPYGVTWNAGSVASGSYDLRIAVTDNAGNVFRSAPITIFVDSTPPGVDLENPGAVVSGTITLRASTTGAGATRVVFAISPAGANSWTDVATDTSEPWSASLDTTRYDDGGYDLRATVYDGPGNFQSSVRSNIVFDNRSPTLVSSTPSDGSIVASADSIELVASEALAGIDNAKLDGVAPAAPILGGTHATFNTGALATGAHTLTGTLRDAAGHTGAFAVHFTVRPSGTALPDPPAVESNTSNNAPTTVSASDGSATVTMPAGAWPSGGAAGDWVVLRVDPLAAAPSGLLSGFGPVGHVLDVTAHWALSGVEIHQFNAPLDILFAGTPAKSLPLTDERGWHVVPPLDGPTLPSTQPDGFFRDAAGTHVETHHLTRFLVANDVASPSPATGLRGTVGDDGMTLSWTPGKDNSGFLGGATVYANGLPLADAGSATEAKIGRVDATDTRAFTVVQSDLVGNTGTPSRALRILPNLTGMTPAQARTALAQRGLALGNVTVASAPGVQPGTIAQPNGLSAAEEGTRIDLVVAASGPQTKLALDVVAPKRVTARLGSRLPARITVSKRATVSATLYGPSGRKLRTWTFAVNAGVTIEKLQLPDSAKRPGRYKLVWVARSGVESVKRTTVVAIVAKRAAPPKR